MRLRGEEEPGLGADVGGSRVENSGTLSPESSQEAAQRERQGRDTPMSHGAWCPAEGRGVSAGFSADKRETGLVLKRTTPAQNGARKLAVGFQVGAGGGQCGPIRGWRYETSGSTWRRSPKGLVPEELTSGLGQAPRWRDGAAVSPPALLSLGGHSAKRSGHTSRETRRAFQRTAAYGSRGATVTGTRRPSCHVTAQLLSGKRGTTVFRVAAFPSATAPLA